MFQHHFQYIFTDQAFIFQTHLEIEPRFPLFGGWQTTFTVGYGLPLQDFVFYSDGKRFLNITFGSPIEEILIEKLIVKVWCVGIHSRQSLYFVLFSEPYNRNVNNKIITECYDAIFFSYFMLPCSVALPVFSGCKYLCCWTGCATRRVKGYRSFSSLSNKAVARGDFSLYDVVS